MPRCARCGMHLRLCLCAELQPLELTTRVVVVCSASEALQPTNTGRLVPLALSRAEMRIRGRGAAPLRSEDFDEPARRTLLLLPGAGTRELSRADDDGRALTLVVPDDTWRAARRMATREEALAGLERVQLPAGPPSRYRLRSHPLADCLATFEAVARALGILEGTEVQARLERVFELFVERTLFSRGRLGGRLPAGIARNGRPRWFEARDDAEIEVEELRAEPSTPESREP